MLRADVQTGVYRSWGLVEELGLGETFSSPVPLGVNEEFRDIALNPDSSFVDVYMAGLKLSHYNFLISDYSYFQFSWQKENYVRFAFYPNPFAAGRPEQSLVAFKRQRDLLAAGLITQEEYLSIIRDAQAEIRIPLIRYENAPDQHKSLRHPCSHLHIGFHSDNRWPVNRLLTPLAFTLNVMKQYYGEIWRLIGSDDKAPAECRFEQLLIDEKQNCRIISDEFFMEIEARSFHFS